MATKNPMPSVEYEGERYKLLSRKTPIPDFTAMTGMEVHLWLIGNTRGRGYSRTSNPLAGFGGAIVVGALETKNAN